MRVWERLKGWAEEEAGCVHRLRRLSRPRRIATQERPACSAIRNCRSRPTGRRRRGPTPRGPRFMAATSRRRIASWWRASRLATRSAGSRSRSGGELEQAQALIAEQRRSARRLRGGLAGAAALLVLTLGAAVLALTQRAEARRNGAISLARQRRAGAAAGHRNRRRSRASRAARCRGHPPFSDAGERSRRPGRGRASHAPRTVADEPGSRAGRRVQSRRTMAGHGRRRQGRSRRGGSGRTGSVAARTSSAVSLVAFGPDDTW